jgi:CRP/FNR family transcriptional regulator, nitrogen oxide reductase regulator
VPELLHIIRLLQQVPLFRGLEPVDLRTVAQAAQHREVERGKFFFRQGEPADVVYVLQRGQVKLTQSVGRVARVLLRFLGPGEVFGHPALTQARDYPITAQAVRWSKALAWKGSSIVALMEDRPRIALNALADVSVQLEELRARYRELATERVEQRVARALLRLAAHVGFKTEDGLLIDMPLSRQDLAEMTGTTLFTVSRILRLWERNGLVEVGRQRVAIVRAQGLTTIAGDLPEQPVLRASR